MTKTFLRLLAILLLAPLSFTQLQAQSTSPLKTSGQDEPLLLFDLQVVRSGTGEIVTGLSPADFKVLDEGFTRPVRQLSYGRYPLSIVLLADVSKGFQTSLMRLRLGLANAFEKLNDADEVSLIAFGERSQMIQEFTKDRNAVAEKFRTLDDPGLLKTLGDGQQLEKALAVAGAKMEKVSPSRRKLIILMTSENAFSWLPKLSRSSKADSPVVRHAGSTINGVIQVKGRNGFSSAFLNAVSLGGVFAGVGAGVPPYPVGLHQTPPVIRTWAARTGGEVFASEGDRISTGLIALFERMRERVIVGFAPMNKTMDGSFRRLDLMISPELTNREGPVELRFPEGYLARPGSLVGGKIGAPAATNKPRQTP
jgi:VWFA-related protein